MRTVGLTLHWHGNFSKILSALAKNFPNIRFEIPTYGYSLILNIPEEYDSNEVYLYLSTEFSEYSIVSIDNVIKTRLIIITI